MKKSPIQDSWGQEHSNRPWDSMHGKIETCEMCGATKIDGEADSLPQHSGAEFLLQFALMSIDFPRASQIILRRVIAIASGQEITLEEIGARLGMSRQATFQHCEPAAKAFPTMAPYLTPRKFIEDKSKQQEVHHVARG